MSRHGPPEGRRLIEARLERWRKEWGARGAELDAAGEDPQAGSQRMAQVNMIEALLLGKSWKLSEQEAERLKRGCATRQCREHFQIR